MTIRVSLGGPTTAIVFLINDRTIVHAHHRQQSSEAALHIESCVRVYA